MDSPKAVEPRNNKFGGLCEKIKANNEDTGKVLSKYVTQYEEKPAGLKHTTSENNLLKPKPNMSPLNKRKIPKAPMHKNTNMYYISSILNALNSEPQTSFSQLCASHIQSSFEFLSYVHNAQIQVPQNPQTKPLPPPTKKNTIVFDLDETLVHCLDIKKGTNADISIPILFPDSKQVVVGINVRPYTRECLIELSRNFEIIVFTASHESYAKAIVDLLDPDHNLISYTYSREDCHKTT